MMAYNPNAPADDEFLADFPPEMREQLRAIIEDVLVNSDKLRGLIPGNNTGNVAVNNGTLCADLNADQLDGHDASYFSADGHVHAVATTSSDGFMSNTDKTKLDGISTGAEVNQNAFASVMVGQTNIQADSKQDSFELAAGDNIAITPDGTNDKITIGFDGVLPVASGGTGQSDLANVTVGGAAKDGNGNIIANTYFPFTGGKLTGPLLIEPPNGSFNEGVRIAKSPSGWATIILGANRGTSQGSPSVNGGWFIGNNTSNELVISNVDSTNGNSAFWVDTNKNVCLNGCLNLRPTLGSSGSAVNWNPATDFKLIPTGNNQEWSFDLGNASYTGSYFHFWSTKLGKSIACFYSDNCNVTIPNGSLTVGGGITGGLTGNVTGNCSGSSGSCTGNATTSSYPYGFTTRQIAPWPGQGISGNFITRWDAINGSSVCFIEKSGQAHVIIDGQFWQNEGRYRCLDTTDACNIAASSLAANGYIKFNNNITIQWGTVNSSTTQNASVTFPISFPSACRSVVTTQEYSSGGSVTVGYVNSISKTGCKMIVAANVPLKWIAIGY